MDKIRILSKCVQFFCFWILKDEEKNMIEIVSNLNSRQELLLVPFGRVHRRPWSVTVNGVHKSPCSCTKVENFIAVGSSRGRNWAAGMSWHRDNHRGAEGGTLCRNRNKIWVQLHRVWFWPQIWILKEECVLNYLSYFTFRTGRVAYPILWSLCGSNLYWV